MGTVVNVQGMGVLSTLFVIFVVFKLLGVITWSWWWITLPLWGPIALLIAVIAIMLIIIFITWSFG